MNEGLGQDINSLVDSIKQDDEDDILNFEPYDGYGTNTNAVKQANKTRSINKLFKEISHAN